MLDTGYWILDTGCGGLVEVSLTPRPQRGWIFDADAGLKLTSCFGYGLVLDVEAFTNITPSATLRPTVNELFN